MYGGNRGAGIFAILAVSLLVLCLGFAPEIISALTQTTHTLDIDSPFFNFETHEFNGSNYGSSTDKEFDYAEPGNFTFWVSVPKNSSAVNTSLNVKGKITTIYKRTITLAGMRGISIGNLTSHPGNEIMAGRGTTSTFESPTLFLMKGNDGSVISTFNLSNMYYGTFSTAIGNVTADDGNEIAFGHENKKVHLLKVSDSGYMEEVWNYSTLDRVNSVIIDDIDGDGKNEVIAGSGDNRVYVINGTGGLVWNYTTSGSVFSVSSGELTSDSGKEIAVGAGTTLYVLNCTGGMVFSEGLGNTVNAVSTGNMTSDPDDETVTGDQGNVIRLFNVNDSGAFEVWNYTAEDQINSVTIGEAVSDSSGNEVIAGSNEPKVYTLSHDGSPIWDFVTDTYVQTVAIGNMTADSGNEVAAGDGHVYAFNFDYFPTNVSLDVGGDGDYDWEYPGKLRTSVNASGFVSEIDYFLSSCTPGSDGKCDIPFVFHSDWPGKLNLSGLNVSYSYYLDYSIGYQYVSAWSRTDNVRVNESVGNYSKNVTFSEAPADDIDINYIRINGSATECDFNGSSFSTTDMNGQRVCDITSDNFVFYASSGVPFYALLWDNTMSTDVPLTLTESDIYYTNTTDDFNLRKPVSVHNHTTVQFTNIIANVSVDYPDIRGAEFLNVTWNSVECDITPSSATGSCDTSSPSYSAVVCNSDTFYVCKEDTDTDSVVDFFKWKQPYSDGQVNYEAGGSTNLIPSLSNANVTPQEDIWGSYFNFSVDVTDTDGDFVNVTLWMRKNLSGEWGVIDTGNLTGSGILWFNLSSDKSWVGSSHYKFEYQDFNTSFYPYHSSENTSNYSGPVALKHNSSVIYVQGNNSEVNRSGTGTSALVVRVNDTSTGSPAGEGVTCEFWVTTDGSAWDSGYQNTTNSSGFCRYDFDPDGSYSVGNQTWKAGVSGDPYYNPSNSTNHTVTVKGLITINFTRPGENGSLNRNASNLLVAGMYDPYGQRVEVAGYNCSFWYNGSNVGNSSTQADGTCNYTWDPSCSPSLGSGRVNVSLWGDASDLYYIADSNDHKGVVMKDTLVTTITNPLSQFSIFKGDSLNLNSSVNDTCGRCSETDYNVTWYRKWKRALRIDVNETSGLQRTREPFVINGSALEAEMINLSDWRIDHTMVLIDGQEIPHEVKAWTDGNRTEINESLNYLNQFSELVFLLDSDPLQSQSVWVYYNTSSGSDYNLSYIPNGGFEGNSTSGWNCTSTSCPGEFCICRSESEGSETEGNFSLHLGAEAKMAGNLVWASLEFGTPVRSEYVKVRYKLVGEYDTGSSVNLTIGNVTLDLNTTKDTWSEAVYNNVSFYNSTSVKFSVHDFGDGGNFYDACHIYVDYICISNSSGDCVTHDSGADYSRSISSQTLIEEGKNVTWDIPLYEDTGVRTILANSTGIYHEAGIGNVTVHVRGWSNLTDIGMSSAYCWYSDGYLCMQNGTVDTYCSVDDLNTSEGIYGYNVSYYAGGTYAGSALTNESGVSSLEVNLGDQVGERTIICNATDDVFYNITGNSLNFSVNVTGGNTTGSIILSPSSEQATGITKESNHSFDISVLVLNTGDGAMYSPEFNISLPAGMHMGGLYCPPISPGDNCSLTRTVNVTNVSSAGNHSINITVKWSNADSTQDEETNQTLVTVEENPVLRILESYMNHTIPRGYIQEIGNFTLESFGNTNLSNITMTETGGEYQNLSNWLVYSNSSIESLSKGSLYTVHVNISVPYNASEGIYITNVTANATGSRCSPADRCWDSMLLNISVILPDWQANPGNASKTLGTTSDNGTIGAITVRNNREQNSTFTASLSGNGTSYMELSRSSFNITAQNSTQLLVYHNSTDGQYSYGKWFGNLTINNTDSQFPDAIFIPVYLDVVNLSVDILSPNQSSPAGPVNASDTLNITANATNNGVVINDSQVMGWGVLVGGQNCTVTNSTFDNSSETWNISCTLPEIPGNPVNNTLKVYGTYQGIEVYDEETGTVVYDDITPPNFSAVFAPNARKGTNPYVLVRVNITDNTGVNDSWISVTRPGGTDSVNNYTISGNEYTFNYSNPDVVGDYDITVYANDSKNQVGNTTGWFDVYIPIEFSGEFQSPDGDNQSLNLTFYREGTDIVMHSLTTNASNGSYNLTAHRRNYDILAEFGEHTAMFRSVNVTQTAINQHGVSDPGNLTSPIRFDVISNSSNPLISNINLPLREENVLMAFMVEAPYLSFSGNSTLSVDYSEAISVNPVSKGDLELFVCGNWSYSQHICDDNEFDSFSGNYVNNQSSERFDFNVTSFSAFAIGIPGQLVQDNPPGGTTTSTGPGGITASEPECGNGICESGENEINCPEDCLEEDAFDIVTGIGEIRMHPGDNATYPFYIINNLEEDIEATVLLEGLGKYIRLGDNIMDIPGGENRSTTVYVLVPKDTEAGTYMGSVRVSAANETKTVPVRLVITYPGRKVFTVDLSIVTRTLEPGQDLIFNIEMHNLGTYEEMNMSMEYIVREIRTKEIIAIDNETLILEDIVTLTRNMELGYDVAPSQYMLEVVATFGDKSVKDSESFTVAVSFWDTPIGGVVPYAVVIILLIIVGYFARDRYKKWRKSKVRYIFPLDYRKLPQESMETFWMGKIAETDNRSLFDPRDLTTHILVAGATGAGKSVAASVIVEEALENKIPVIVFDPTAQWTGFVKACEDDFVLNRYSEFGMDPKQKKSYKGMIYEIEDPHVDIDIQKYMNPGEITVFVMNKLKAGEYDISVKDIIDDVFSVKWEESTSLKMIIVFDEVHRLLEKYGGKGGYVALERACREFRKWGIGVIMCSQVLTDFKEAISGNVLTDIQLNTKAMEDINRVKDKYGPEYAQRISRQGIGVGMFQNPKYNEGKPYFVQFRPTYHNPHKISNEEMNIYKEFARRLSVIEEKINAMKKSKKDTGDIELDLKLAKDKLKQGRFRMAKIYITSLEKLLKI